jgi:hypothetical protein
MKLKIATVTAIALACAAPPMSQGLAPGWPCTPRGSYCDAQLTRVAREDACKSLLQPLPPALENWPTSPMNDQQFAQFSARIKAASDAETAREIAALAMSIKKQTPLCSVAKLPNLLRLNKHGSVAVCKGRCC